MNLTAIVVATWLAAAPAASLNTPNDVLIYSDDMAVEGELKLSEPYDITYSTPLVPDYGPACVLTSTPEAEQCKTEQSWMVPASLGFFGALLMVGASVLFYSEVVAPNLRR